MAKFKVKIDQLPEEEIDAADVRAAARKVGELIQGHEALRRLADEGPVQIKREDNTPWGRHLTIGDFRSGLADAPDDDGVAGDGPSRPAKP